MLNGIDKKFQGCTIRIVNAQKKLAPVTGGFFLVVEEMVNASSELNCYIHGLLSSTKMLYYRGRPVRQAPGRLFS